jgi:hypothetical protein
LFDPNLQNRGAFSNFNDLAEYSYIDSARRPQVTKFTLTISNWHFVRDHREVDEAPRLEPKHCNFSFKVHSTTFATKDRPREEDEGYQFDRVGCIIPYSAFLSLLSSPAFTQDFIGLVEEKFKVATLLPSTPTPSASSSPIPPPLPSSAPPSTVGEPADDSSSEVEDVLPLPPPPPPTSSKSGRGHSGGGSSSKKHRRE